MDEKQVCSLMFDATSIKRGLFYNISKDKVDGIEDLVMYGKSDRLAKYAMVFGKEMETYCRLFLFS